ncbi:MAG: zinc ABC transporter substrate-binding protein [Rhodospirillales bacterium]|nr:zinc ABC transporter substrate-binding protein [Rhodospirillales bacterium]
MMIRLGLGMILTLTGPLAMAQPMLRAVGLESQYADVLAQIGGPYVKVVSVQSNPNTDPHEFEVTPGVAAALHDADLVVENGLGYDAWADQMLEGSRADVLSAQKLLNLPDDSPNPHLWYRMDTMPKVAAAAAAFFEAKDPAHKAAYMVNLKAFDESLTPWRQEIAQVKAKYAGAPVAVTEPVADYLLQAAGMKIMTPFSFELSVMNDTDPSPQDVAAEEALLRGGKVRVFAYNEQVADPETQALLALAKQHDVQILPVYELMPASAAHYQDWMLQTATALNQALAASAK